MQSGNRLDRDLILVGLAHGAHGVRGLVKVESLSDNPQRYEAGSLLYAVLPQRQPRPLTVASASAHKNMLLVTFAEINSREEAQQLLGAELQAPPDEADLAPGQYYHYQLMGLRVYQHGEQLGEISAVLSRPANDIYVAQTAAGGEIWIPALKAVVKNIDIQAGRMDVELPEGLKD